MIISLIKTTPAKIILFFAISPGNKYMRKEIKENTGINNLPLDISLNELLTLQIINKKEKLYSLNLENSFVQQFLKEIRENISILPLKIQFILIDFIRKISKIKYVKNVILFGSYSKLIFTDKSDIDFAIVLSNKIKNSDKIEKMIINIGNKLSRKYKKQIQEHFLFESDLIKHKKDNFIKDILRGRFLI